MIKKFFFLILLVHFSCIDSVKQFRASGPIFGTTYSIIYDGESNLETAFDSLFSQINRSMSTYIKDSDISDCKFDFPTPNCLYHQMESSRRQEDGERML